ncbi:hypothetical protein [Streptomyces sp. NPDC058206]|uniref:hypothetical protein n=1 Tax=Streptomyces sp. NPDC058206 TaxID=3346382 RepID=UPI0036ED2881
MPIPMPVAGYGEAGGPPPLSVPGRCGPVPRWRRQGGRRQWWWSCPWPWPSWWSWPAGRSAIHHRPLGSVLRFSAELRTRLAGEIDADYFHQG